MTGMADFPFTVEFIADVSAQAGPARRDQCVRILVFEL